MLRFSHLKYWSPPAGRILVSDRAAPPLALVPAQFMAHPLADLPALFGHIERALITCEGTLVTAAHLAIPLPSAETTPPAKPAASSMALGELQRKAIIDALQRTHDQRDVPRPSWG